MKIVDSHMHVWSIDEVDYYENKSLATYMLENSIKKTSLIALSQVENIKIASVVESNPDKFFGIGYVDHQDQKDSLELLEKNVKAGVVRGIKLYPYSEHFMLDADEIKPIYRKCLDLDIPILLHVGWQRSTLVHPSQKGAKPAKYSTLGFPIQFGSVLESFPNLKMIFAHMGGNYYFECLGICQRFPNVYMDTAWLQHYAEEQLPSRHLHEWIEHACKYLGSEKIMFGGEGTLPRDIEKCQISNEDKENILGRTAMNLYKLGTA
ncbi:MAG: amidohydrolase family protein [Anaerolineaceae bacterium]|jgi:predicted TIM-barrel fold metal-dependent hydrolase